MSPIKGLSNKVQIPRLGKIRLGIKKTNGNGVEYPVATDYFVLPKEHPQHGALVELFGEQPKELRILIPLEDEDKWCSQYYRCYSKSRGLICKGDGVNAIRMVGKGTNDLAWKDCKEVEMKDIECKGTDCEHYKLKRCNEILNLQFMIPEVPGLGVWQIDSTSINSIKNINSMSALIKSIYRKIAMIPLSLTLEPREVNNPESGKKKTVYLLNLRTNNKLADLAIAARHQEEQFLLPVGDVEPPDDGLGYQPDFEPCPPDTHTAEQNIDNLWPDSGTPSDKTGQTENGWNKLESNGKKELVAPAAPPVQENQKAPLTNPATITSIELLYKACFNDFKLQPNEVLKELGISSKTDITDPSDSYKQIAAVRR